MTAPDFRPLGFGEILDGAFTLYRRNLPTFLVTALVVTLGIVAMLGVWGAGVFAALASGDPALFLSVLGGLFLLAVGIGLGNLVMWGALTREAAQSYLGQPTSVADGLRTALRKLLSLLGAGILIGIALAVAYFGLAMVVAVVVGVASVSGSQALAVVLTFVVAVGALAVFLMLVALLFAVVPAIIVEDKGPLEAISRSFDLASGARGRIMGLMIVTVFIAYLPIIAVFWLTGSFADLANPQTVPTGAEFLTQQLLSWGVGVLTTPFMASVIVLLYFDRRVRTEALDVQIAAGRLNLAGA